MAYTKATWIDNVTPVSSPRMNNIEGGVARSHWFATTTNVGNVYSATLSPIPALFAELTGTAIRLQINAAATGAVTININGLGAKNVKTSQGAAVANWKLNAIVTLVYNGTDFISQGEGSDGTALAADVLISKTATVLNGDIVGTMPDNGANSFSPSTASQSIPLGKYNGSGTVNPVTGTAAVGDVKSGQTFASANGIGQTGTMPLRTADNVGGAVNGSLTVGRVYIRPADGWWNGAVYTYWDDANFIAANIPNGMNMFGLAGTGTNAKRWASGTAGGFGAVTGLGFTPSKVMLTYKSYSSTYNETFMGSAMLSSTAAFYTMYGANGRDVTVPNITSLYTLSYYRDYQGAVSRDYSDGATNYITAGGFNASALLPSNAPTMQRLAWIAYE